MGGCGIDSRRIGGAVDGGGVCMIAMSMARRDIGCQVTLEVPAIIAIPSCAGICLQLTVMSFIAVGPIFTVPNPWAVLPVGPLGA